ncbi:hypothetical protein AB0K00_09745 [Dactylosporangium sp. NPDC049525]|uniref:hypothetical protein n=1 Tax=Dactylosporangium sp. NPDC049525 TaxID=3154730 RepID=UPI0034224809
MVPVDPLGLQHPVFDQFVEALLDLGQRGPGEHRGEGRREVGARHLRQPAEQGGGRARTNDQVLRNFLRGSARTALLA